MFKGPGSLTLVTVAVALASAAACRGTDSRAAPDVTIAGPIGIPRFVGSASGGSAETSVDFGRVRLGSELQREVVVANGGGAAFTVTEVGTSAAFSTSFRYAPASFTVDPEKRTTMLVTFAPTTASEATGDLFLIVENGSPAALTIHLRGVGYACDRPEIAAQPWALSFGDLVLGGSREIRLAVANVGAGIATCSGNLLFGIRGEDGAWREKGPEIVGPDASDFSLEWPTEGYSSAGLAEDDVVELRVRFTASSTGRKEATLVIASNDANRLRLEVPLSGIGVRVAPCEIAVQPPALNFGVLEANHYLTLSFQVRNLDGDPAHACLVSVLDPSSGTESPTAFQLVNGPVSQAALRGGESLSVPVRFVPHAGGLSRGEISLITSDLRRPEVRIPLLGFGQNDCLMLAPVEIDFGTIAVGCSSRQKTITAYNTRSERATVTDIDLQPGASGEFTMSWLPGLPATIAGGASLDFGVTFRSTAAGGATGVVTVRALETAVRQVRLFGQGGPGPRQTDVYSQSEQPKVDVLFVVDNSVSMSDKVTSLASNFASFISYAANQKADIHFGVTTTDVSATGEAGRFVPLTGGNPRVLTRSMTDLQQFFVQNVAVGTSGSEAESLIRPAYLALTNPLINGHNAGFYRDEAKLAVVIVSDAADQDPLNMPVSFYEIFLQNIKGIKRNSYLFVSAIVPLNAQAPAGCSYDSTNAGADPRVKQLVQRNGGLIDDICTPDWHKTLEKMATRVFGIRTTFFLSNTPDMAVAPDPIVITVEGQRLGQFDPSGSKRWDYNAANNAIEFDPLAVPDPGTTIAISYYVACL